MDGSQHSSPKTHHKKHRSLASDCKKNQKSHNNRRKTKEMLSRDCDGCSEMRACSKRYTITEVFDKVYCPDGTAHLIDGA